MFFNAKISSNRSIVYPVAIELGTIQKVLMDVIDNGEHTTTGKQRACSRFELKVMLQCMTVLGARYFTVFLWVVYIIHVSPVEKSEHFVYTTNLLK
jgi:hypothetical protein